MFIYDPLGSERTLRNSDEVVQKLIELRDMCWENRNNLSQGETYLVFKINSCLYEPKKETL